MTPVKLMVIGGGEHARVVIEAAQSRAESWVVLGFVDPSASTRVRGWASVIHGSAIHGSAIFSATAEIAPGAVVMAGAIVQAGARIGAHAVVNSGAVSEHDVVLGSFAQAAPARSSAGHAVSGTVRTSGLAHPCATTSR